MSFIGNNRAEERTSVKPVSDRRQVVQACYDAYARSDPSLIGPHLSAGPG
jgi:hypothetical protein